MTNVNELHKKWLKNPEYRTAFEELKPEFELAQTLIQARSDAGLTQKQVAARMKTSQAAVARMESGRKKPSTRSLDRYALVVGKRLRISLVPADGMQ